MGPDEAIRLRGALDRMVREKEVAAVFFARMAESLGEVDQRRWFRRMAQDEKDQRKIVIKHRRELCGSVPSHQPVAVSAVHAHLAAVARGAEPSFEEAVRLSIRSADEAVHSCRRVAELVADRSFRIFLKILGAETLVHRDDLLRALRRIERTTVEDVAA